MDNETAPAPSGKSAEAATGGQARAALLKRAKRLNVPLRREFVQLNDQNKTRASVLASFVNTGAQRSLRAYLTVLAASSAEDELGWYTEFDSMVWARLFDAHEAATTASARTAAWRTLQQLADKNLVEVSRVKGSRKIGVRLLREDGSGKPYTRPGLGNNDPYFNIPTTFWTKGFDEVVGLPGLAMLLVLCGERKWRMILPEHMPKWYGWSADTTERGLKTVMELNLVERREKRKAAPLSPLGFTRYFEYRVRPIMRPKVQRQRAESGAAA
ncbi:hypothetical protein [Micromonospora sp. NPDC023814]|uniref:hypothetical protein n=1 Tax=Micromonospora sp. NPDC023814 TaxID=3154596 RepID=UPI0033D9B978